MSIGECQDILRADLDKHNIKYEIKKIDRKEEPAWPEEIFILENGTKICPGNHWVETVNPTTRISIVSLFYFRFDGRFLTGHLFSPTLSLTRTMSGKKVCDTISAPLFAIAILDNIDEKTIKLNEAPT